MTEHAPNARPGRFSLRELFILTALVCVASGFFFWARADQGYAWLLFAASAVSVFVFTVHTLTRYSWVEILVPTWVILLLLALLLPGTRFGAREAARRMQCNNHLKQIGLALHSYHDVYGSFPPAFIADAKGRPLHSWRVLILPFMEQKALYDKYSFDEPWDGPSNSKLHGEALHVFSCPSATSQPRTDTSYVVVIGPFTAWPGAKATKMSDIPDGTSNTILVTEVVNSGIHWMEPRDLHVVQMPMAVNSPRCQGISSPHPNAALAVFADGHTQALNNPIPAETLRALLTIAGNETIGDY